MKNLIRNLFLGLSVLVMIATVSSCQQPMSAQSPQAQRSSYFDADPSQYITINNLSTNFTGPVTISDPDNSISVMVNSIGTFDVPVTFTPTSITINGLVCPYPSTTVVPVGIGENVSIAWTSPSLIPIIDYGAQN